MLFKFALKFLGIFLSVLVLGVVLISVFFDKPPVEFWILLVPICFGLPVILSVLIAEDKTLEIQ